MIKFEIGETYSNNKGKYKVKVIHTSSGKMLVDYENGDEGVLDMAIQSRIMENKNTEKKKEIKKFSKRNCPASPSFYETVGYLSLHCYIYVRMPSNKVEEFEQIYFEIKKCCPGEKSKYICVADSNVDKWGISYLIEFRKPKSIDFEDLDFCFFNKAHSKSGKNHPNTAYVSCRILGEFLLDFGFELGLNNDPQKILASIPEEFKEPFNRGLKIT